VPSRYLLWKRRSPSSDTSKAIILTSAEPREWFHLPDSADRPIGAIELRYYTTPTFVRVPNDGKIKIGMFVR
jgi:hypothetical protein